MVPTKFPVLPYGGDYNPDQWPEDIWHEDMRLFREAGINTLTLPVFAWARIQPAPDVFDFEWLDRILGLIHENGLKVCLSTPTVAQPAWMARMHPEMMPVDEHGRRRNHGKRVNFCPNSPIYRHHAAIITEKMAGRYGDHPALMLWHVANEYGTWCFCDTCAAAFREWLKARYGTIEALNRHWNLSFWGHLVSDWEDVVPPSELNDDNKWYPAKMLDYQRFMTDASIGCFENEAAILRRVTPNIPVTTNISGLIHRLDQFRFAPHVDIIAWDNYPHPTDPPAKVALKHDLMRGLRDGQSFLMIESTPSQQNWQPYNVLKQPGLLRLLGYQALAHGADGVMYFQMRASVGGVEKFHGAVIGHSGTADTRVFRECAAIGRELEAIGVRFQGARTSSRIAVIFDWDSWWGTALSSGPSRDLEYFAQVQKWYTALHGAHHSVDIVRHDADLSGYDLVVAPLLYLLHPGDAARLEMFVSCGGTLVVTTFSGMVDENDNVGTGGYPAELRHLLGLWVEEFDALLPGQKNRMLLSQARSVEALPGNGMTACDCGLLCGLVRPTDAEPAARYGEGFYAGTPCLTRNEYGQGTAWYVATDPEDAFVSEFLQARCREAGIRPVLEAPADVEVTRRETGDRQFTFLLNHAQTTHTLDLAASFPPKAFTTGRLWPDNLPLPRTLTLPPLGVAILETETDNVKEA